MMPSERTMNPVPSPWPAPVSTTTFTTAGRTLFTTFTTASLPLERTGFEEGKLAAGEPFVWGGVVAESVLPVVHADSVSAARAPSARTARLMVMTPVCRVQAPFDTRQRHVHRGGRTLPENLEPAGGARTEATGCDNTA